MNSADIEVVILDTLSFHIKEVRRAVNDGQEDWEGMPIHAYLRGLQISYDLVCEYIPKLLNKLREV